MRDIEHKASIAWDSGSQARAAWDFLRVNVAYHPREEDIEMQTPAVENAAPERSNIIVVEANASATITQTNYNTRGGGRPRGGNRPDKRIADRSDPSSPNDTKRRR